MLLLFTLLLPAVLCASAIDMYDSNFPHIPWEVVRLAEHEEECHASSSPLFTLLLPSSSSIAGLDVSTDGKCPARLVVRSDPTRWPRLLVTVQCACERRRCSPRGHQCLTVLGPVRVLRSGAPGDRHMLPTTDMLPIGCVCASQSSIQAQVITPIIL